MIPRSIMAFALSLAFVAGIASRYRTRRSAPVGLLLLSALCFVGVATMHVFEALGIFPAAGWGQPHSLGHYLDLSTAMLGATLLVTATLLFLIRRRTF